MVFQTLLSNPRKFYFSLGAINCAIAVATGAFGAHGLKNFEPRRIEQWKTGAQYHFLHGLGLMAISQIGRNHHVVGSLLSTGIILFSGSLYALVLTDKTVSLICI